MGNCGNSCETWEIVGICGNSWGFVTIKVSRGNIMENIVGNAGNRGKTQENVPNRGNSWEIHRIVGIREQTWENVNSLETILRKHEKS